MKNWKTTLAGLFGAFLTLAGPQVGARLQGQNAPPITAGNIAPAIGLAALGLLSKDHDSTGGVR